MTKVVINGQFGGFGLSRKAYEKLIEWGVPVRKYVDQERDPETGRYKLQPLNEGEVIFDRDLDPNTDKLSAAMRDMDGRYWETWIDGNRSHPLLIRVVEELGDEANGRYAQLKIVEIPDNVGYKIDDYDGLESIHETHQVWS